MLQGLSAFGIHLGFGDKTVNEICCEQGVDCYTFLTVVNFLINGYTPKAGDDRISVKTLLDYLRASHRYFLDFQLPSIRKQLEQTFHISSPTEGSQEGAALVMLIMRLYDEYAHDIRLHMNYEERTLFPYVEALIHGIQKPNYNVDIYAKHHSDTTGKFHELKNIIIKYLPHDGLTNNQLTATLYDMYNNEEWLSNHSNVEELLFVPAIRSMEQNMHDDNVSARISSLIRRAENNEPISEREKEIIVCLVQGLSNKEIANRLYISVNTVTTHRRNIIRKLQIHSLAGLTIYAIANNLIDKSLFEDKK
jgi:regulator of cell morphogenesis and NO signaling